MFFDLELLLCRKGDGHPLTELHCARPVGYISR
jgi:hypothetical protein